MANRKNTFLIKRSNVAGKTPAAGDLQLGELAINTADVILYASGTTTNSILPIGWDRVARTGDTMTGTLYVPTVSATTISATVISFDTNYTGTTAVGSMTWNSTFGTPQVGLIGGNVVQKIGETVFSYVRNDEATTLNKGEIVYIFGATGDKISVRRASSTGDTTSLTTLGVVAESIASGALGYVITQGTLDGLNLGSYTAGDILWLGSTPGSVTNVKQYAPNHLVFIGVVQRANAGNGQLYVKPQNGYELEELHNVMTTGATYGDLLVFSAYNGYDVWVNTKTLNGSYTITGNTTIGGQMKATTISATTYSNLPTDIRVTGATYSANTFTYRNNTGGTFNVLFNTLTGLTVNGNLNVTGTTTVGGTNDGSTKLYVNTSTLNFAIKGISNSTGVLGSSLGGSGVGVSGSGNGGVGVYGQTSGNPYLNAGVWGSSVGDSDTNIGVRGYGGFVSSNVATNIGGYFHTDTTVGANYSVWLQDGTEGLNKVLISKTTDGKANWSSTLSALTGVYSSTISATTYQNLPTDIRVTGGTYDAGTAVFTNNTGGTFSVSGFSTGGSSSFTGGTITGPTNFTAGLTANTISTPSISATTYYGLPKSIPYTNNKSEVTSATTIGNDFNTGVRVSGSPINNSYVGVTINGLNVEVGDGVTTKDCYFSSNGTSGGVRNFSGITTGDYFMWNTTISGYDLDSTDIISFYYNIIT